MPLWSVIVSVISYLPIISCVRRLRRVVCVKSNIHLGTPPLFFSCLSFLAFVFLFSNSRRTKFSRHDFVEGDFVDVRTMILEHNHDVMSVSVSPVVFCCVSSRTPLRNKPTSRSLTRHPRQEWCGRSPESARYSGRPMRLTTGPEDGAPQAFPSRQPLPLWAPKLLVRKLSEAAGRVATSVGPAWDWESEAPRLQARLAWALQAPAPEPEDDFANLFTTRWAMVARRLPFRTDVVEIGRGLIPSFTPLPLCTADFPPIFKKLSCNAWRLGANFRPVAFLHLRVLARCGART
jgi:hypothetical protein